MAATLKVISAGAAEYVVTRLAKAFTRDTGTTVIFTFNTIAGVRKRLESGETGDVVIGTTPAIAQFQQEGFAVAGSTVALGRTLTGLCVRQGTPVPDISTPEKVKAAMQKSRAFAYTDPAVGGTSGIYLTALMERFGILDEMKRKAVLCINGEDVVSRILSGEADLGSTFISEFFLKDGIASAGPLPPEIGNATSYSAALLASGKSPDMARSFIATITAPEQRGFWTASGFEPAA
jgi:molybdate transport system substrate-binding protein